METTLRGGEQVVRRPAGAGHGAGSRRGGVTRRAAWGSLEAHVLGARRQSREEDGGAGARSTQNGLWPGSAYLWSLREPPGRKQESLTFGHLVEPLDFTE